jgi:hypothetical protein
MKPADAGAVMLGLGACGKVQETAAEKAIESSMARDGTQAKVNMSEGGMKVTATDASGKTSPMEIGKAQVSESDLGVPFYPGSKPAEGGSMRIATGEGTLLGLVDDKTKNTIQVHVGKAEKGTDIAINATRSGAK